MESPRAESSTTGREVRPRPAWAAAGWLRWVPGIQIVRHYEIGWLRHDLVAGLALTAVLVPVGIAYAVGGSGLPGICDLYATVAGLLAYLIVERGAKYSKRFRDYTAEGGTEVIRLPLL